VDIAEEIAEEIADSAEDYYESQPTAFGLNEPGYNAEGPAAPARSSSFPGKSR
jgi:glycine betaine catabolism B